MLHWDLSSKNADTKEVERVIRPKFPENGLPLPKSEIEELVQGYVDEKAPTTLRTFFRVRANGAYAKRNKFVSPI